MKEPLNLRISDAVNPQRGAQFATVLCKRKARAAEVIRGLVDAYIMSDGKVDFPVQLISAGEELIG